ncbi:MAG: tetratricopeptide repeat-containing glycosyltransferase family protein [Gemmatimonadaceae bacterium]|nr:tetratricopeptide repeat-containing glycosyltransferase family protein [Gemmatimonadaceae bacterium]
MAPAALATDPRRIARIKAARAAYDAGRPAEAVSLLEALLRHGPPDIEALATLGSARLALFDVEGAIAAYSRAAELAPKVSALALLTGHAYKQAHRPTEAGRWYQKATALAPHDAEGWIALAWSMRELGQPIEAIACCHRAAMLDPTLEDAPFIEGCAYHDLGRFDDARRVFDRLAAANPDNDAVAWNRALLLFLEGRWPEAWAAAERRHESPKRLGHFRDLPGVPWRGEALDGKTILVQLEQGLGDQVQFLRYCQPLKARGARVIFEASPPLVSLLRRSPYLDEIITKGAPRPPFDYSAHLMSLPFLLNTGADLLADALPPFAEVGEPSAALRTACEVPDARVGLVWGGEPKHHNDRNRSIGLAALTPLLEIPGIHWFSLQKGAREAELRTLPPALRARISDLAPMLTDFSETAQAVRLLDLVITVDTSVAHIAGSLGVPTWILLPFVPDWRWMAHGETTGWYPSVRLWRQPARGDWASVVHEVDTMLRAGLADAQQAR